MQRLKPFIPFIVLLLALALVACGGDSNGSAPSGSDQNGASNGADTEVVSSGDPAAGEAQYNQVCIACHGPEGQGVQGLGLPFTTSNFVESQSDAELLEFIKQGRPIGHPDNTTGVDMPPKGGNPALTDEQILDIIAYIRSVHE